MWTEGEFDVKPAAATLADINRVRDLLCANNYELHTRISTLMILLLLNPALETTEVRAKKGARSQARYGQRGKTLLI